MGYSICVFFSPKKRGFADVFSMKSRGAKTMDRRTMASWDADLCFVTMAPVVFSLAFSRFDHHLQLAKSAKMPQVLADQIPNLAVENPPFLV